MMGSSSREGYHHEAKQEGSDDMNKSKVMIPSSSSISTSSLLSSSRQWSAFRNPRIVRVSRSFGGKDRHSKVCTIRGLRDRRIRLSVPTAIQLYELQDKLGLNQPSKVIDWLLEATKLDIDKLPPLQFPTHGLFNISSSSQQFLHPYNHHQNSLLFPHHHDNNANNSVVNSSLGAFYDPTNYYPTYQNLMMAAATKSSSRFCWDTNSNMSMDYSMLSPPPPSSSRVLKGKELLAEKGKWIIKTNGEQEEEEKNNNSHQDDEVSATSTTTQRLFPPLHGLLNNATSSSSYGGFSYYHHNSSSEHSNSLSLSQFVGSHGLLMLDPHTISGNGVYQFASSSAVAATTPPPPSLFSPYAPFLTTSSSMENNNNNNSDPIPRQFNHIHQFMNSSPQVLPHYIPSLHHHSFNSPVRPFPPPLFSSKLLDSNDYDNNNNRSQSDNKG